MYKIIVSFSFNSEMEFFGKIQGGLKVKAQSFELISLPLSNYSNLEINHRQPQSKSRFLLQNWNSNINDRGLMFSSHVEVLQGMTCQTSGVMVLKSHLFSTRWEHQSSGPKTDHRSEMSAVQFMRQPMIKVNVYGEAIAWCIKE